ncbi:MAG: DUF1116 domain-containing protein [Acidimicrobiales bacterium]
MSSESNGRETAPHPALPASARVANVGLPIFAEAVRAQKGAVVDVDWRIPAGGKPELVAALERLCGPLAERVDAANQETFARLDGAVPMLVGVGVARDVVPGLGDRMVLHAGPPLDWADFCDPLRRAVRAAVMAEGWASSPEEAERRIRRGEIDLSPANHHAAVMPMAGALGVSAPVVIAELAQGGCRAYSGINQGPGAAPWFGVETPEAVAHLAWLGEVGGPVLDLALQASGPVDIFSLAAQGLQMGDDVHMRSQATTNLLLRHLLPFLVALDHPRAVELARFLSADHLFFLNIAMAGAKATVDWASSVPCSSAVVAMARNGTSFGLRLSATGDAWFTTEAPEVSDALYHPGFGPHDGALDIGDSAVLELVGLGGAAAAASPAVAGFLGGNMEHAVALTRTMEQIRLGRSRRFKLPALGFSGSPVGIDVRRAVELGATPSVTTGILHARDGTGQVGAGVAHAPLACFEEALLALDRALA